MDAASDRGGLTPVLAPPQTPSAMAAIATALAEPDAAGAETKLAAVLADESVQKATGFPDLSEEDRRAMGADAKRLLDEAKCRARVLSLLRILARDETGLELVLGPSLGRVLELSGLSASLSSSDAGSQVDAVKVLCNAGFTSQPIRAQLTGQPFTHLCGLLEAAAASEALELELVRFLLRLFFLLTAKEPHLRDTARSSEATLSALTRLCERLTRPKVSAAEAEAMEELQKSLFNVLMTLSSRQVMEEHEEAAATRLVQLTRVLLEVEVEGRAELAEALHTHAVNLLTALPAAVSAAQLSHPGGVEGLAKGTRFMERDTRTWHALLAYLQRRLTAWEAKAEAAAAVVPVLVVLSELVRVQRSARKFFRQKVLPPLGGDVGRRPEEGQTLRNRLAKLMTSPNGQASHLVAEFLFQLCKRSVERLIKYTGFGNAAGLLANEGLLGGGWEGAREEDSSDDDSDTEEYRQAKPSVNPVTGCVEPPELPGPMDGMSEEQKEHEAMRLVQEIDRLMKQGLISPATVGQDGKPRPVDHILELTKDVPDQDAREDSD